MLYYVTLYFTVLLQGNLLLIEDDHFPIFSSVPVETCIERIRVQEYTGETDFIYFCKTSEPYAKLTGNYTHLIVVKGSYEI